MIRKCLSECEDGNGDDKINDSENEDDSFCKLTSKIGLVFSGSYHANQPLQFDLIMILQSSKIALQDISKNVRRR